MTLKYFFIQFIGPPVQLGTRLKTEKRKNLNRGPNQSEPPILSADGSPLLEMTASVQKCGDVHLWGGLVILKYVRYLNIDGFEANVLSVGKLCDDSDAAVFFAEDECCILEKSSQKRIAVAHKDPILRCFVLKCCCS